MNSPVLKKYIEQQFKMEIIDCGLIDIIQQILTDDLGISDDNDNEILVHGLAGNMIIFKYGFIVQEYFKMITDVHPITEWSYTYIIDKYNVKILLGYDFFGIRHSKDEYGYYLKLKISENK